VTLGWFVHFFGLALVYASVATVLLVGLAAGWRGRAAWRWTPLVLATAFFVFLTQHPFPVADQMVCPMARAEPQLQPLRFMDTASMLMDRNAGLAGWLGNKTIAATIMNVVTCVLIGMAMAPHVTRFRTALLSGAVLTLTVELTQLTGVWGLFPCAYRQFNVDDISANMLGVAIGFAVARHVAIRFGPSRTV